MNRRISEPSTVSFPKYTPGVIFYGCHEAVEGFFFGPQAQIRRQCEEEIGRVLEEKVVGRATFVVLFFTFFFGLKPTNDSSW